MTRYAVLSIARHADDPKRETHGPSEWVVYDTTMAGPDDSPNAIKGFDTKAEADAMAVVREAVAG